MRAVDLIEKKKHGEALTKEEIDFLIEGYTKGAIPDYQMSSFLMAVYFKGMNKLEISNLTMAMVNSGDKVDLSKIKGIKVDKHSSGGVGDKISLIVIPLVASAGVPVAKLSGRGLGHTGGTIDKLESIKGFKTSLSMDEFINNVNTYKMAIIGQTANLTPADKKLYALRDVTATVDSIPLIASSIMSKKIASGADCIVLDVKTGSGAFMKTVDDASTLAETMVEIGKSLNRKTVAVVSDMSQPLGHEVGNANEVCEAIRVLKGMGAEDETTVALTIASIMTVLGGAYKTRSEAHEALTQKIKSGEALNKFKELIKIQGGNPEVVDNTELLPKAKYNIPITAEGSGYVTAIEAEQIGLSAMMLGAGRKKKDDIIDFAAGITLEKKVGDSVNKGENLCILHTNLIDTSDAIKMVKNAYTIGDEKPEKIEYIHKIIE